MAFSLSWLLWVMQFWDLFFQEIIQIMIGSRNVVHCAPGPHLCPTCFSAGLLISLV